MTNNHLELAYKLFDDKKYSQARAIWEQLLSSSGNDTDTEDILFNIATCYANEGNFERASSLLKTFKNPGSDILYNLSLCNYKSSLYEEAENVANEVIDLILTHFPDLEAIKDQKLELESSKLCDTLLVQSINLKAAILYKQEEDCIKSLECLKKISFNDLSQLDCVTLHNTAIYETQTAPEESLRKLEHLVWLMKDKELSGFVPQETLTNLLLLYIYEGSIGSAKLLMQNESSLLSDTIDEDIQSYFRCCIEAGSDQVLYERLDRLLQALIRNGKQSPLVSIISSQLSFLLWNSNLFEELEDYLLKTKPYINDPEEWSENMAHTLFMQDTRYQECTSIYEEMMMSHSHLSQVSPIILCNLCISYILSGKNNEAEALIKEIEALEWRDMDELDYDDTISLDTSSTTLRSSSEQPISRLTLINLAVGTLYCIKCNYQFGLSRIIKTLTPFGQKLTVDTWFIAKSCILSLLSNQCRQIVCVQDHVFDEVIQFLMLCERVGRSLLIQQPVIKQPDDSSSNMFQYYPSSVTQEARLLRSIVVKIFHE